MANDKSKDRTVRLHTSSMVDSIADWPLSKVVAYLKKKESEKPIAEVDCRLFCTYGMRMFNPVVDELARSYGTSRGGMCRYLSYHGVEIAKQDKLIIDLDVLADKLRKRVLDEDSPSLNNIQNSAVSYSPREVDNSRVSVYVYSSWVSSGFTHYGRICGVAPAQVAQIYMVKSILTSDSSALVGVANRLQAESDWWGKWMRYRLTVLEVSSAAWES